MKLDLTNIENIEKKIYELCELGSIRINDNKAHRLIGLMVKKANNNLKFAKIAFRISNDEKIKPELGLQENDSFFDWAIVSSYYAMFYITHALLATINIRILRIRVHEATIYALAKYFIINKELEDRLFFLYEDAEKRAEELFTTLSEEKKKRGSFTYERLPKANKQPAKESIENAAQFIRDIESILKMMGYT